MLGLAKKFCRHGWQTQKEPKNHQLCCRLCSCSSLLYYVNKPAVVREKFVKIVKGLPGVPVTEKLNFFENEYSKNKLFPPILIFY